MFGGQQAALPAPAPVAVVASTARVRTTDRRVCGARPDRHLKLPAEVSELLQVFVGLEEATRNRSLQSSWQLGRLRHSCAS